MTKHFLIDLSERVLWTFVQAALGALTAVPVAELFTDVSVGQGDTAILAALVAGGSAVFSLLKGVAAGRLKDLGTAQLIPGNGGTYVHDAGVVSPDERLLD